MQYDHFRISQLNNKKTTAKMLYLGLNRIILFWLITVNFFLNYFFVKLKGIPIMKRLLIIKAVQ